MAKRHIALQTLSRQHHHGLALALRLQQGGRALLTDGWTHDLREQRKRVTQFYDEELTGHFAAEERALFPVVMATLPHTAAPIKRLVAEHRELAAVISRLDTAGASSLAAGLRECGALLERHIRFEEREFFPLCERELPGDRLALLGQRIEAALEEERSKHRRALFVSRRRVINAPTARLFAVLSAVDRYAQWWPGGNVGPIAAEKSREEITLALGPLTLSCGVAQRLEGKHIELHPTEGAGYLRLSIMDYRGGREVTAELNLDLPPGPPSPTIALHTTLAEVAATLDAALEALERVVKAA